MGRLHNILLLAWAMVVIMTLSNLEQPQVEWVCNRHELTPPPQVLPIRT